MLKLSKKKKKKLLIRSLNQKLLHQNLHSGILALKEYLSCNYGIAIRKNNIKLKGGRRIYF
jgi:hypothetical protein